MLRECQGFVEKVGEIRFNKVKQRQVNKFNNLLRKEGNITGYPHLAHPRQAGRWGMGQHYFPGSQCSSQQFSCFPGRQV